MNIQEIFNKLDDQFPCRHDKSKCDANCNLPIKNFIKEVVVPEIIKEFYVLNKLESIDEDINGMIFISPLQFKEIAKEKFNITNF